MFNCSGSVSEKTKCSTVPGQIFNEEFSATTRLSIISMEFAEKMVLCLGGGVSMFNFRWSGECRYPPEPLAPKPCRLAQSTAKA
eukprot:348691-Amphidinium_carterae.1